MTRSNGPYDQAPHWRRHTRAEDEQTGQAQYASHKANRHFGHQDFHSHTAPAPNAYSDGPGLPENYDRETFHGRAEVPLGYDQRTGALDDYRQGEGVGVGAGEDVGYYQQGHFDPQLGSSHLPTGHGLASHHAYANQSAYGDHQAFAEQHSYQDHNHFVDHGSGSGQDWQAGYGEAHSRPEVDADFVPQLPNQWAGEASPAVGPSGYPSVPASGHQQPDANAFDLGNYAPNGPRELANRPSFGEPGYAPGANWEVDDQGGYADRGHYQSGRYEQDDYGAIAHPNGTYDDEDEFDEEYESETGGGRRWLLWLSVVSGTVVTVLAGVIYVYMLVFNPPPASTRPPIVEADALPAKVQPTDPGGKKFEHKESALIDRIGDSGQDRDDRSAGGFEQGEGTLDGGANDRLTDGANGAENLGADTKRVRSVSTLVVGRDGRLIAPDDSRSQASTQVAGLRSTADAEPAAETQDQLTTSVPGLMIVGGPLPGGASQASSTSYREFPESNSTGGAQQDQTAAVERNTSVAAAIPEVQPIAREQAPAVQSSRQQPRRSRNLPPLPVRSGIDKPQLAALTGSQASAPETRAPARANVTRVVPPPGGALSSAAASPSQQTAAAASGRGFVAVLSTKRTRIEALTSFADLRSKYSNILSDVVPEVKRADLSDRGLGVVYRAVIGPASSRETALRTCTRLKAAGYSGCWVAPY